MVIQVNLFDETKGYEDKVDIELAPNLTEAEIEQALKLYRFFNGLQGLCVPFGMPGSGKDVCGNYLTWLIKRYFPSKKIWRDEKPRALFGEYAGIFNEEFLIEDMKRMKALAINGAITVFKEIKKGSKQEVDVAKMAKEWTSQIGEVMLKDSVLYLTEFWRYFHNRRPHNPMGITLGGILKEKRHLDCLIIGSGQMLHELDRFSCLPYIDWRITCTPSQTLKMPDGKPRGFIFVAQKVKFTGLGFKPALIGQPFIMRVDAGKEREELGGKRIFDLFNSKSSPQIDPAIKLED